MPNTLNEILDVMIRNNKIAAPLMIEWQQMKILLQHKDKLRTLSKNDSTIL